MRSSSSPPALARRALIEDIKSDKSGWLRHGVAALAVSVLGLGVAGSLMLTSNAQETTTATPQTAAQAEKVTAGSTPSTRSGGTANRDAVRAPLDSGPTEAEQASLDPGKIKSLVDQRAEELGKAENDVSQAATDRGSKAREQALEDANSATNKQARVIADGKRAAANAPIAPSNDPVPQAATEPSAPVASSGGRSCTPVTTGYSIAARFGQVGAWARYHTGFDFSAPVGTPLHAPASGVVTNAGGGPASGWAGNYVAIKYPDGTQTLMAHMSTVSVSVGQNVSACQVVGAIGMTGRTFGPHVHFEVYPAGVTPGDVYKAVNPVNWMAAHGLKP